MKRMRSLTSCIERRASEAISWAASEIRGSPDIASASLRSTTEVSEDATEPWRASTARSRSSSICCCSRWASILRCKEDLFSAHPAAPAASRRTPSSAAVRALFGSQTPSANSVWARYQSKAAAIPACHVGNRYARTAESANRARTMKGLENSEYDAAN